MKAIWFFEEVNLLKLFCPHTYKQYKSLHASKFFSKNDYIYFEEDQSKNIFLIEKGKVKIGYYKEDGKEVIKAILTKGDLFGEMAFIGETKRCEFAQSIINQTAVCEINTKSLEMVMREKKNFSLRVHKLIRFRIRKLERRIDLLLFKDIETRFLKFLDDLCEDYGYFCNDKEIHVISHPYTQQDIASLIGVSRTNLNATMNSLREKGVIDFTRNTISLVKNSYKS